MYMLQCGVTLNPPHSDICYFLDINSSFNQIQGETHKALSLMKQIPMRTWVLWSNLRIFLSQGAFLGWRAESTKLMFETFLSEYSCPKVDSRASSGFLLNQKVKEGNHLLFNIFLAKQKEKWNTCRTFAQLLSGNVWTEIKNKL